MTTVPFTAVVSSLILAALTPAKVTDVNTNSSAAAAMKRPTVIYVKSFSTSRTAATPEDTAGGG